MGFTGSSPPKTIEVCPPGGAWTRVLGRMRLRLADVSVDMVTICEREERCLRPTVISTALTPSFINGHINGPNAIFASTVISTARHRPNGPQGRNYPAHFRNAHHIKKLFVLSYTYSIFLKKYDSLTSSINCTNTVFRISIFARYFELPDIGHFQYEQLGLLLLDWFMPSTF